MRSSLAPVQFWWTSRSPREQVLLLILMAAIAVWLAVVAVWQPLLASRQHLIEMVARHERALAVLQTQPVAAAPTQAPDDRPLANLITETAAAFQLTISRLEPEGARIRVVVGEASFDAVILWIEALQRDQGLRITELEFTRRPAPGVVNAILVLEK